MKQNSTRRGFTLIELLVVVIIIAILAAIALPQYQKAVMKARVAELQTFFAHVEKAMDLYVLEHGYSSGRTYIPWDELGIDVRNYCDSVGGYSTYTCTAKNFWAESPFVRSDCWHLYVHPSESVFGPSFIHIAAYKDGKKAKECEVGDSSKGKVLYNALKANDSSWEPNIVS